MESNVNSLYDLWNDTIRPFQPARTVSDAIWRDLARRYTEPTRTYHNLTHIERMQAAVRSLSHLATDLNSIQLATWFHDVIYIPGQPNNEADSARYAHNALWQMGVREDKIAYVEKLIMATKLDQPPTQDINEFIMRDADLETLGGPPSVYQAYNDAIQEEFRDIPDEIMLPGRVRIMEGFLARDRIYLTAEMFDRYEQQARRNIANELTLLHRLWQSGSSYATQGH